ncbi:coiled-coil domain-containing protein 201-like [Felis catus]|uniref:coiled-coil domain-containing protein 201-like n=1 Tax=Felis catus TaxID=9685 RepID=UPI0003F1B88A|nr:coiled-coil domain-containing protein 201-like [Felis catus]
MESGAQVSGLKSTAEDEGPSSVTSQLSPRNVPKHSTPRDATPSLHRRPPGRVPYRPEGSPVAESPLPESLSWSTMATLQNLQLSTVWPAPASDPWDPEEDPPTPASVTRRQRQAESGGARSRSPHLRLPGVPNTSGKRRRDPKELAAVTERVRQWEVRLLRDIEEATHHELTIEDDCILGPGQEALCSGAPAASPPSTGFKP